MSSRAIRVSQGLFDALDGSERIFSLTERSLAHSGNAGQRLIVNFFADVSDFGTQWAGSDFFDPIPGSMDAIVIRCAQCNAGAPEMNK